jgi:Tfp pilus assembly protein PilX
MDVKKQVFEDESGAALVISLVMMVVLTLIGLASILTSTFEIRISGNKRGATDAFYSAETGVQVAVARADNFNTSNYDPSTHQYNPFTDAANTNYTNAQVSITHDTSQTGAPRRSGMSATHVGYIHFVISSTGQDQLDLGLNRSRCTIDEKVIRIIPSSE